MKSTERQEQIAVVQYLRLKYPDVTFFAIPNGGSRNAREAANMKKEGVTAGVPDLFVARTKYDGDYFADVGDCWVGGLFIEMKSAKGKISGAQIDMMGRLSKEGYRCEVCYSADEAIKVIDEYLS